MSRSTQSVRPTRMAARRSASRAAGKSRRPARPRLESLEDRKLLTVDPLGPIPAAAAPPPIVAASPPQSPPGGQTDPGGVSILSEAPKVIASSPAHEEVIAVPLTTFTLTFDQAIDPASVQPEDCLLNGVGADHASMSDDGRLLTFTYDVSPITYYGYYSIDLLNSSVQSLESGLFNDYDYTSNFVYEQFGLSDESLLGSWLNPSEPLQIWFNRSPDWTTVSPSDFVLSQGAVASVVQVGETGVALTFSGITWEEKDFRLTIPEGAILDLHGNPIQEITATFDVHIDFGPRPFPTPFARFGLAGSLTAWSPVQVLLISGYDGDSFKLPLAANQTLTLYLELDYGNLGTLSVSDPDGKDLAYAYSWDEWLVLRNIPIAKTGVYTVYVGGYSGRDSSSYYVVYATLNATDRPEDHRIDDFESAYDLNESFMTLGTEQPADRASVIGWMSSWWREKQNYYSFDVSAGQPISITARGVNVRLYDAEGNLLVVGSTANGVSSINAYVPVTSQTLFARLDADTDSYPSYEMVVTRGATFSLHGDGFDTAQPIGTAPVVLGAVTSDAGDWFQFNVSAGDVLSISTLTPGGTTESGLQFVNDLKPTIYLYDASGNLVASASGNAADGRNSTIDWTALGAGAYRIQVAGADDTTGEYVLSIDVQSPAAGNAGGLVYNDADGNGVRDAGEAGLAGASLVLKNEVGDVVATVTTDAAGAYAFVGVPEGAYTVSLAVQPGVIQTGPLYPAAYSINVTAGDDLTGLVFGSRQAAAVSPLALIHQGDPGYAETGVWSDTVGGLGDSSRVAKLARGRVATATASWTFDGLSAGEYQVYVSFAGKSGYNKAAAYSVFDGGSLRRTETVNQSIPVTRDQGRALVGDEGTGFLSLGTFQVNSGTLEVLLGNTGNGNFVNADSVLIVRVGSVVQSIHAAATIKTQVQPTASTNDAMAPGEIGLLPTVTGKAAGLDRGASPAANSVAAPAPLIVTYGPSVKAAVNQAAPAAPIGDLEDLGLLAKRTTSDKAIAGLARSLILG